MRGWSQGQLRADYGNGVEAVGRVEFGWWGGGHAVAFDVVAICEVGELELERERGVRGNIMILKKRAGGGVDGEGRGR